MDILTRIFEKLKDDFSTRSLFRLVLLLAAVFLLQHTWQFALSVIMKCWNVVKPFFYGFVIAYVLHRPLNYFESKKISRKIMVPVFYLLLSGLLVFLMASMVPMLANRISDFINTMISSVRWVRDWLSQSYNGPGEAWISNMVETSLGALTDVKSFFPSVTSAIPDFVSRTFNSMIIALISVIISIFMCFEWDKIRFHTVLFTARISLRFHKCVFAINDEFQDYLRSMIIVMAIRFVEYSLLYLLCGHPDWLLLGIASAISPIIPYVGPTAVNTIGILSALHLPMFNVVMLIVMICILAQIDEYVITPMVHSHNLNLSPLWILFSIFASSALFGFGGFIIAIPIYLILRVVIRMYFIEIDTSLSPADNKEKPV